MIALLFLALMLFATGLLGYMAGRRGLDESDRGWLPPERRRWRP